MRSIDRKEVGYTKFQPKEIQKVYLGRSVFEGFLGTSPYIAENGCYGKRKFQGDFDVIFP